MNVESIHKTLSEKNKKFKEEKHILSVYFYMKDNYTVDRRSRLILIERCLFKHKIYSIQDKTKRFNILKKIERGIYNHACDQAIAKSEPLNWVNPNFIRIYNSICFKIQTSLCTEENKHAPALVEGLCNGLIDPNNVGKMKIKDLNPLILKEIYATIDARRRVKIKKTFTTQFKCPRCRKRCAQKEEEQKRSGDEGVTLKLECMVETCRKKWEINT